MAPNPSGPTTSPPSPAAECFVDGGLGKAPANPPLQLDLPASRVAADGWLLVAPERAAETAWRMECYQRWPRAAQAAIDAKAESDAAEIAAQKRATQAVAKLVVEELEPEGPPWGMIALGGGVLVAVSFVAGAVVGFTLGAR